MTEVSFHFNVDDSLRYACRLLRKAVRSGARVVVTAPGPLLAELDRVLWTFDALEFVPHARLAPGQSPPERLLAAPVWLVERATDATHCEVLLNLGPEAPEGFERFARVIEVVSTREDDKTAGRARWKHYAGRGYSIQRHEVAA
jgi:DNA polymerase-3 subunit chi